MPSLVVVMVTSLSSGIHGELSAMVQANPTVRDNLGPALLGTFVAVAVVEGLDVDKENFDKHAARFEIAQLLKRLWLRHDCRESILRQCGGRVFQVCCSREGEGGRQSLLKPLSLSLSLFWGRCLTRCCTSWVTVCPE